ncbi:MAG: hypothetical protein RLZZ429_716 [Bacteroidota bacterium]|jgi:hypothetical protein
MKLSRFILLIAVVIFASCNNDQEASHEGQHTSTPNSDSVNHASTDQTTEIKSINVVFKNVDAKAAETIKQMVDNYLQMKDALAADKATDAATAAKKLASSVASLDQSLLTAEQKKVFDQYEADLNEHAEHIGQNGDNIEHQRSHFIQLSEVMYDLVKNFGAGRPLYHDHCPMARDNQGAMWLSEVKEIKNPYFGAAMFTCGQVQEVIQ